MAIKFITEKPTKLILNNKENYFYTVTKEQFIMTTNFNNSPLKPTKT